jgi:hypothetical protein
MTGRDLIVYILANGLEDEPIYGDGKLLGFINPIEAAAKFNVASPTIYIWVDLGMLDGVWIGDTLYIPAKAELKHKGETQCSKK